MVSKVEIVNAGGYKPVASVTPEAPIERYWTVNQVAERLHVTADAVKVWLRKRRIQPTKAGTRTLISESELQRFLKACTEAACDSKRRFLSRSQHTKP